MRRLIVDGYNAMHAWPEAKRRLTDRGLDDARRLLVQRLAEYRSRTGIDVTVVFDAHGRSADAARPEVVDGVVVRFGTRHASADHVIERMANEAARRGEADDVVVVTADRLQRAMVGAMGLATMSPLALASDIARVVAETSDEARRGRTAASRSRRVEDQLSPDVVRRLEDLRRGRAP